MDLQSKALEALVADLADARTEYRNRQRLQSVSLSAPTGSGKTVMATALVERILDGDADHAPAPQSSLLWLTDQPELNEQTRQKMLAGSTTLGPSRLTTIESSFDERVLPAGVVSFLNIQKLSSTAGLLTASEERRYLFWETFNNTVSERGADFYLVLDEAHRGMRDTRAERKIIVQRLVLGDGTVSPVPLVLGLSATLERFQQVIGSTSRTMRAVTVPVDDVRASGLLKEKIILWHPKERQPSSTTLLRAAVQDWLDYDQRWRTYSAENEGSDVLPVLVIQVEDGSGNRTSNTGLAEVLTAVEEVTGGLDPAAYCHAFDTGRSPGRRTEGRSLPGPLGDQRGPRCPGRPVQKQPQHRVGLPPRRGDVVLPLGHRPHPHRAVGRPHGPYPPRSSH